MFRKYKSASYTQLTDLSTPLYELPPKAIRDQHAETLPTHYFAPSLDLSFPELLKKYKSLSKSELSLYANLYANDIIKLYKTKINKQKQPIFSTEKLHEQLITSIPSQQLSKIHIFKLLNLKPDISYLTLNYNMPIHAADTLTLNYSKPFVELILPYQSERIKAVYTYLFSKFIPTIMSAKFQSIISQQMLLYKDYPNPIVFAFFKITNGYEPDNVILSNNINVPFNTLI